LRSSLAKEILRNLSSIWARSLKVVRQPYPRPKKVFKNIGFKGRQIITLPGATTCIGQALSYILLFVSCLFPSGIPTKILQVSFVFTKDTYVRIFRPYYSYLFDNLNSINSGKNKLRNNLKCQLDETR